MFKLILKASLIGVLLFGFNACSSKPKDVEPCSSLASSTIYDHVDCGKRVPVNW
tara:strand:+ start:3533 stop:3694 length:162 start_codon:yes stop_codon:yes gene_type:complete